MTPAMSVLLVTDVMESVDAVISTFRRQTIADRLELVLATTPGTHVPDDTGRGFAGFTVVRIPDPTDISHARAECTRAATAPVVAIGETHCLPEPRWCEALLATHEDPQVAISGCLIMNANPQTAVSAAALLMDYGPWATGQRGPRNQLPAHNVAYSRELLLAQESLERALEVDSSLNEQIIDAGRMLLFEPGARAHHLNVSKTGTWLKERAINGRTYAGHRAANWGPLRRLGYALAWPLVPLVRIRRLMPVARELAVPARVWPAFVISLVLASAGEGVGYLLGPGNAPTRRHELEISKVRHVREGEAAAALDRVLALEA